MIPRSICGLLACVMLVCVGCDDPINEPAAFEPAATEVVMTSRSDQTRYEWPLSGNTYMVPKPSPMAFVTAIDEPLRYPHTADAPLIPWDESELEQEVKDILRDAYEPHQTKLDVKYSVSAEKISGPLAFDISHDGKRMVTIESDQLGLYDMEVGKLIGHLKLPAQIDPQNAKAVRFCGATKDLLLGTSKKLYRISGKNGAVVATCKGPGEPLKTWVVNPKASAMLVLDESGRIFTGDPSLAVFAACSVGKDRRFSQASISENGQRIVAIEQGKPVLIRQTPKFELLGEEDLGANGTFAQTNRPMQVAGGIGTDSCVNGDELIYVVSNDRYPDQISISKHRMFWRPVSVSAATNSDESNWLLVVGMRFRDGKEEPILFDFGPISRNHSTPISLPSDDVVIRHNRDAGRLALLTEKELQICHRNVYQNINPAFLEQRVHALIGRQAFDQLEKLCAIVQPQKRLGHTKRGEQLLALILEDIGLRWQYLERKKLNPEVLEGFDKWEASGSPYALTASAIRHHRLGWEARGGGFVDSVTASGWQTFQDRLVKARENINKVFADKSAKKNYRAHMMRITLGLEMESDLAGIDPWCLQAVKEHPFPAFFGNIAWKLTPQWYGERGDTIAFARSSAQMFSGSESDMVYAELMGVCAEFVHPQDTLGWRSFDRQKLGRGIDEWKRRDLPPGPKFWQNYHTLIVRANDNAKADEALEYIGFKSPVPVAQFAKQPEKMTFVERAVSRHRELSGNP